MTIWSTVRCDGAVGCNRMQQENLRPLAVFIAMVIGYVSCPPQSLKTGIQRPQAPDVARVIALLLYRCPR